MATESHAATSWSSIPRAGSLIAWTGVAGAITSVDANWAEWPLTGAAPGPYISEKLRSTFPSFSLPPADVINAINVYVRHKQPATPNPLGATCIFENTGADIVSQNAFFTSVISLPTSTWSIATLNGGGVTYDLLYNVTASFPLIFPALTPYVDVDQVILEVITSSSIPISTLENVYNVIPSICTKVIN